MIHHLVALVTGFAWCFVFWLVAIDVIV